MNEGKARKEYAMLLAAIMHAKKERLQGKKERMQGKNDLEDHLQVSSGCTVFYCKL